MIELYHAEPIANSVKVMICLFEKGVEFKSHYVNLLAFEQHSPEYLAINPDGIVPSLVHDGVVITETTVINEYLDEVFPEPALKPRDPVARARMRTWTKWIDEYFGPNGSRIGWQFLLYPLAQKLGKEEMGKRIARIPLKDRREKWTTIAENGFTPEQLAEARSWVEEGVRRLESLLEGNEWTAGDEYSLSDIATYSVAPSLPMMMPNAVNPEATPNILRWIAAMDERPAVQKAKAMPNKVRETLQAAGL